MKTKETLLLLCASLCLGFAEPLVGQTANKTPQKEVRKASTANTSADSLSGQQILLADGIEIKKRISEIKKQQELDLERELAEEALDDPAGDLYGDDSWGGHVNLFGSVGAIPDRHEIDLNEFVMPISRKQVTSHYGYRSRFGRMHYGTDLALSVGDTVKAAFSGKVRISSYEGRGYGNYVVIRHPNGLETVYGHLHRRMVREGTVVKAGDVIGLGGNTGRSTGPHLHFEARFMGIPLNPGHLFDFAEGVPQMDTYVFRRGAQHGGRALASRSASKASSSPKTYRVQKGDTLYSIAQKHGTTVAQLMRLNRGLKGNVKVNKTIRIS